MNKISATIVADSIDNRGNRIISYILTYPRFIHSELMTHRMFSRNSASSRAVPFEKMVKMVKEDPFIPIAWQKDHKGMQGTEYITAEVDIELNKDGWLRARDNAVSSAKYLNHGVKEGRDNGVTKQLCNRLLEPFMWHTVLVTATEYDNFFNLRCPKYKFHPDIEKDGNTSYFKSKKDWLQKKNSNDFYDIEPSTDLEWLEINESQAEIHIQALAEAMWDAKNKSIPKELKEGEWHLPFGDKIDDNKVFDYINNLEPTYDKLKEKSKIQETKLKIAIARAARLSYMTFDGEIDYEKDIKLFETLLNSRHLSPFEHIAKCMSNEEYYSFVKGKVPSVKDQWGFVNLEYYPIIYKNGNELEFKSNENRFGWCNNFKGFIPYRYFIE